MPIMFYWLHTVAIYIVMETVLDSCLITVLDLGLSNTATLASALHNSGFRTQILSHGDISGAKVVLLSDHCHLYTMIQILHNKGWYNTLREHIISGKPYLGIGTGMQLLFEGTSDDECVGMSKFPGFVEKLESWDQSVPLIGFEDVFMSDSKTLLQHFNVRPRAYFAQSHGVLLSDDFPSWVVGTKAFGDQHIATLVQHGRVLGSQFCPTQIGGAQGLQALRAMLNTIRGIDAAVADNLSSDFDASSGRRVVAMLVATIDSAIAQVVRFGKVWKREIMLRGPKVELLRLLEAANGDITEPVIVSISDVATPHNDGAANNYDIMNTAEQLFRAGANRIVLGTEAVQEAAHFMTSGVLTGDSVLEKLSRKYGTHAVAVSIDAVRESAENPLNPFANHSSGGSGVSENDDSDNAFPALGSCAPPLKTLALASPSSSAAAAAHSATGAEVVAADVAPDATPDSTPLEDVDGARRWLQIAPETEDEHPEVGMLRGMGSTLVHLQSGDHCRWTVQIPPTRDGATPLYVDAVVLAKACEIMGAGEVYLNIDSASHFDAPLVNAIQNALRIHVVACGAAVDIASNTDEAGAMQKQRSDPRDLFHFLSSIHNFNLAPVMSKVIEMTRKGKEYSKVLNSSGHGKFSIEDDEDEENVEISFEKRDSTVDETRSESSQSGGNDYRNVYPIEGKGLIMNCFGRTANLWNTLTFSWMEKLLTTGNKRPLEMDDLYKLAYEDSAEGVYKKFKRGWLQQIKTEETPSLAMAFFHAFGTPFIAAGLLKLVHDSSLFVGPQLLNALINFLNDPSEPLETGLWYVFGIFISNLVMSLCLRQYFWSCYRVGMNLRSSVVCAIYNKALAISVASLSRKTLGEITNLMSVDSSRLQDLTPYLHAIWYSLYQITIALFFLYRQMGASCFAGMALIVLTIPLTKRVSMYLKTLQKALSTVRDERIKLTNEVLSGMKVIKLQAWEKEFENRIREVRERELAIFRKYSIAVSMSGAMYTAIPLLVAILTFTSYIALGNTLDVATALTSLALFDLLRFPLFMLPQVLNNVVEAKVSVDRVQGFLLESEKKPVTAYPLRKTGALLHKATLVWEAGVKRKPGTETAPKAPALTMFQFLLVTVKAYASAGLATVTCGRFGTPLGDGNQQASSGATVNPMMSRSNSNTSLVSNASAKSTVPASAGGGPKIAAAPLSEEEFLSIVREAQVIDAERVIVDLELELASYHKQARSSNAATPAEGSSDTSSELSVSPVPNMPLVHASSFMEIPAEDKADIVIDMEPSSGRGSPVPTGAGRDSRVLTLARINLQARAGQLISIVGPVGSGKSSLLSALLGDMRCCYGNVAVYGSIAYTAQVAFIQNSTLKENIIYGCPYDEAQYQATLEMCALLPDIKVLPAGHETEIGERGINLSGGQKARVGLARAVYADADIYLLDDPLSAVDAHVGQHLFEECILDLKRRGKCVILVTNALQFLKQSSHILVLKDGRVSESGKYDALLKAGRGFTEMIATMQDTSSGALNEDEEEGVEGELVEVGGAAVDGTAASAEEGGKTRTRSMSSGGKKRSASVSKPDVDSTVSMKKSANLITAEDRETGDVSIQVYGKWAVAAGGLSVGALIIFMFFLGEGITVLASWWLSYWSQHRYTGSPWFYLGIYVVINTTVVIVAFVREVYVRLRSMDAGRSLFLELLTAVLFSPMSFFDTTPLGRVINRFSKDIYTIDEQIPQTVRGYLGTMAKVISTILYICVITPMFLFGLLPIMGFYYIAQRYYIKTSRELTRLESTSRSPIYALFSETLDGLATIRAYGSERRLVAKNNRLLDSNIQSYFLNFSANCWLAVRLEFAGTLIVTFAALFAVLARSTTTSDDATNGPVDSETQRQAFAGLAGLAISFAMSVTQSLNWTVRMASDMESQMVSVERVKTYSTMPQEAAHFLDEDPLTANTSAEARHRRHNQFRGPPGAGGAEWPTAGAIDMRAVTMRYRDGLPLVLKGLTLSIAAREKVGIVGRTGAGKSSLLTALLRLVELDGGSILIDRVDISKIGLNTLRSVMAVIPQDPVLFSGTIRTNLDPFGKYSDTEIWEGLQRTLLSNAISSLDDKVTENGANFSVGQRQLLCIARALLSRAKIIIMDEATAAVDVETDAVIQQTIRTEFAHATCLTVAHRLNTIMDSDKVLVMDDGVAAEYDTPANLLADEHSMFHALVTNWENSR